MADGSIKIDVGLNLGKAEKDLAKLRNKIEKTEAQLNADADRKTALQEQIAKVGAEADEATRKVHELKEELKGTRGGKDAELKEALAEATDEQRRLVGESNRLNDEYVKVNERIDSGTQSLVEMQDEAGELSRQIAAARPGEIIAESLQRAKKAMMTFLKYALGIRSLFFLFRRLRSAIKSAVTAFAEGDLDTKNTIDELKQSLEQLKLSWGAAFAPILQIVAPLVKTLIGYLVDAANAITRFIAIISGKSSFKKAVLNTGAVADGMNNISGAAGSAADSIAEVKRQLMGFDELNILDANKSSGSGGGGGGGGGGSKFDTVEEAIDAFDGSFLNSLALSVKDVLFDWSDLNPEQIAEKAISGLAMLLGGATGFMLAGVPGAIVGTLLGLTLSLVANAAIFDHDGVLDPNEIGSMLRIALNGLLGGVLGFAVGGPGGALLGATIGVGFTLLAKSIIPDMGKEGSSVLYGIVKGINNGLAGGVGAGIGFMVGGPGGAAIGAVLGLGLSFIIGKIESSFGNESERSKYKNALSWFLVGVLGLPSDEDWKKYGEDALVWFAQGFLDFMGLLHEIIGGPLENLIENEIPETLEWFKEMGPEVFFWLAQGFLDFAGVLHEIIGGPLENLVEVEIPETLNWFKEMGSTIISNIQSGFSSFRTRLQEIIINPFHDAINSLFTWWNNLRLSPFHIPHPVFEWGTKEASGLVARALQFVGLEPVLPTLAISWYAKGGIFDVPSLIGVGENGKEAVVPLERNTEWMRMVADGLMDRLKQANFANELARALASTPLPAMAGGTVAPPNAYSAGYGGPESTASILDELRELRNAIMRQPIQCKGDVYLDRRKVGESVTEYQRQSERARG